MKKSRIACLLALMGAMTLSMAGCGSTADDGHKIIVWATFNTTYQAIIEKAIKSFETKNAGYKIEYVKQNGSYSDLKDMVLKGVPAGNYPDMVVAYPDSVADFMMTGKSLNIQPYMEDATIGWTEEDIADIPEAYITEGQKYMVPGTYSLPICKSTEAMYYNRGVLLNLDLSSYDDTINNGDPLTDEYIQSLTWEELMDHLCPALIAYNDAQDADHKIITPTSDYTNSWAVVGYDSDDNLFITLAEQYGYGYTSVNAQTGNGSIDFVNSEMKALMKKFNEYHTKHYFTTKGILGKNVNYVSTTGGMLFSIGSTGGVSYQFATATPKDVGVAPIPQAEGKDSKVINQGPSIAFLKRGATDEIIDTRAKGVWNFYKEWTNTTIGIEWATTTGYSPIRQSVMDSDAYLSYSSTAGKAEKTLDMLTARNAKYATSVGDSLFSSPVFVGSANAREAVAGLVADCIGNKGNGLISDNQLNTYFTNAYNNAI